MTRRRVTLAPGILALVVLAADPATLAAQTGTSTFNGTDLTGWKTEHTKADVRDGVLRVGSGNGWVRTERSYADFVLQMDVRLEDQGEAGVYVRAWPTFSSSSIPNNGNQIRISDTKAATEWTRVEVECVGSALTVRVNGAVVHTADSLENPQGHVALWATNQTAQFRAIEIRPRPRPVLPAGVAQAGVGAAISYPKPVSQPKPPYTGDAMRARINGKIVLAATVLPDGTVGDVQLLQSLDPKYGLDALAVETAQGWRFTPGTRDGAPVAVQVMIELDFNLR
jgi:protein TonB